MTTARKTNSAGQIRYEGAFELDDWRIEWVLWPNEPNGIPSFKVTGRERVSPPAIVPPQALPARSFTRQAKLKAAERVVTDLYGSKR